METAEKIKLESLRAQEFAGGHRKSASRIFKAVSDIDTEIIWMARAIKDEFGNKVSGVIFTRFLQELDMSGFKDQLKDALEDINVEIEWFYS